MAKAYSGIVLKDTQNLRSRGWTFSIHRSEQIERLIEYATTVPDLFAYIHHSPDSACDKPHTHFYIEYSNDRFLAPVSCELELIPSMIEKARCRLALLKYFLHDTEAARKKEKTLYSVDQIFANFDVAKAIGKKRRGMTSEEYDFITDTVESFRLGHMSYREMMQVLKPLFSDITPASYFRLCLSSATAQGVKSSDFEAIPTSLDRLLTSTDAGGLSNRVSGYASKNNITPVPVPPKLFE